MSLELDRIKEIFDITPLISEQIAVFPGDTPFQRETLLEIDKGHNIDLSTIKTTVHLGAHADAENHYGAKRPGIDQKDLRVYMGDCQVVEVKTAHNARVSLLDFDLKGIHHPRVLFKTNSFNPNEWKNDFVSLSPEVIEALAKKGVILVGIDTPSIDPSQSKGLESHQTILKHNISVLEGLLLDDIKPGDYQLIALPLKIKGADASPVRAILCR